MRKKLAVWIVFLSLCTSVAAVEQMTVGRIRGSARQAPDLEFPTKPAGISFLSSPHFALYKPEGSGPFPAIVLHHQCGGLRNASGSWLNTSILNWAKEAVDRGYVALTVDSLGPRNVDTVCMGPKGGVNFPRGVKDALQAAEHLRKLDFVDRKRIAFAGYSWGAMVGVFASSRRWATILGTGERFDAVVSFYPRCDTLRPPVGGAPYDVVLPDIDKPLLVLMGELDNETPPQDCVSRLEPLKAGGAPVEWHVYPKTTHCWDCESLHGARKIDDRGSSVVYYYERDVTNDSAQRMFTFIEKAFTSRP